MGFLQPLFLLAAAAVLFPVVLHLLERFRAPRQVLPTLVLLAARDDGRRARPRPWKLLLLLARLLAIAALAFLCSRPYFSADEADFAGRRVVLVLDNSPSMARVAGGRRLLERARDAALAFAPRLAGAAAVYATTTGAEPGRALRLAEGAEGLALLAAAGLAPRGDDSEALCRRLGAVLEADAGQAVVILFSDLQASAWRRPARLAARLLLVPAQGTGAARVAIGPQANLAVTGAAFARPFLVVDRPARLDVRVRRTGDAPRRAALRVSFGGRAVYEGACELAAGDNDVPLEVTPPAAGDMDCAVEIRGDDHPFDDLFRLAVRVRRGASVALPASLADNRWLRAALAAAAGPGLRLVGARDPADLVLAAADAAGGALGEGFADAVLARRPAVLFASASTPVVPLRSLLARAGLEAVVEATTNEFTLATAFPQRADALALRAARARHVRLTPAAGGAAAALFAGPDGRGAGLFVLERARRCAVFPFLPDPAETDFIFHPSFPLVFDRLVSLLLGVSPTLDPEGESARALASGRRLTPAGALPGAGLWRLEGAGRDAEGGEGEAELVAVNPAPEEADWNGECSLAEARRVSSGAAFLDAAGRPVRDGQDWLQAALLALVLLARGAELVLERRLAR